MALNSNALKSTLLNETKKEGGNKLTKLLADPAMRAALIAGYN